MQGICILLLAVHIMFPCAAVTTTTHYEEKMYGDQLTIRLSTGAEKLKFTSTDETVENVIWSKYHTAERGTVTGRDDDRRFVIYSVNFDDQGTYTVLNFWNRKTSVYLLKVITKRSFHECVAGETFKIPLGNLLRNEATLKFSSKDFNITLVDHGSPLGNMHPEYMGRVKVTSSGIEVLNVNVSDVGDYTLSDRLNRKVRILSMSLVDHHPSNAAPLAALLLLLGIPPCICCCCRKRICKKSSQSTTTTTTATTDAIGMKLDNHDNPSGPPPAYVYPAHPAGPTQGYTPGYPAVGGETVHPPPNPTFPPQPPYSGYPATSPAMSPNPTFNPEYSNQNPLYPPPSCFPPAQSPQWSGSPPVPASFVPVMHNAPAAPEPVKGEITPATPLLAPPQPEGTHPPAQFTGIDILHSSDSTVQFNINSGNDSNTKFL